MTVARTLSLYLCSLTLTACAMTRRPPQPRQPTGTWRIRIDVDSAPTRRVRREPLFGTIDFAAGTYRIDLQHSIGHNLPPAVHIGAIASSDAAARAYRIILGDSSSYDEKIVMVGRLVTRDSMAGTWTETVLCCAAAGRFSLWRIRASDRRSAAAR
jgi:hypothetical protein